MRLSRSCKLLLKLTLLGAFSLAIYCLQTPNVFTAFSTNAPSRFNENATRGANISAALTSKGDPQRLDFPTARTSRLEDAEDRFYNVWCIFTKVTTNSPMKKKFKTFVDSLLRFASVDVSLHIISDPESRAIAEKVVQGAIPKNKTSTKVTSRICLENLNNQLIVEANFVKISTTE